MGRRRLGASSRSGKRSTSMGRKSRADRVESALRRADASLEAWFRRGAGVVRQQVNRLQGRLRQVSTGLEELEKDPKPAAKTPAILPPPPGARPALPARTRKPPDRQPRASRAAPV